MEFELSAVFNFSKFTFFRKSTSVQMIVQVVHFFLCLYAKILNQILPRHCFLIFSNLSENFEQLIVKMIFEFDKRQKITASKKSEN
jgi:hypothetical protein